jgi:hypothetical protein
MPKPLPSHRYDDREYTWQPSTILLRLSPQNCESSADSLTCMCASSIGSQLQSCMICVTKAEPSVQSEAQSSLDSWNEACSGNLSVSWYFDGSREMMAWLSIYSLVAGAPVHLPDLVVARLLRLVALPLLAVHLLPATPSVARLVVLWVWTQLPEPSAWLLPSLAVFLSSKHEVHQRTYTFASWTIYPSCNMHIMIFCRLGVPLVYLLQSNLH